MEGESLEVDLFGDVDGWVLELEVGVLEDGVLFECREGCVVDLFVGVDGLVFTILVLVDMGVSVGLDFEWLFVEVIVYLCYGKVD